MEKWLDKGKGVQASRSSKLQEGKYMGKVIEDRGYFSKVCYAHSSQCYIYLHHLLGHKTPPESSYGSPHFSKVPAFSEVGEAQERLLSASVKSLLPIAQSNLYAKVTYFKVYILICHAPSHSISVFHSYVPYMFSKINDPQDNFGIGICRNMFEFVIQLKQDPRASCLPPLNYLS